MNSGSATSLRKRRALKSGAGGGNAPEGSSGGIQQGNLNPLSSGRARRKERANKVPEEKPDLTPTDPFIKPDIRNAIDVRCRVQPWQLYYPQDENGQTPLHLAISRNFQDAALYLIKIARDPAQLNLKDDYSQTALYLAVVHGQSYIARKLILKGADPMLTDFDGNTPLHVACKNGDLVCARALTDPITADEKENLPPDAKVPNLPQNLEVPNYKDGQTCLHVAAIHDRLEIVRLLVILGVNLNARELLEGRTALHLAMKHRSRAVYIYILRECPGCIDTPNYAGLTAYQIALKDGDYQSARELLNHGAKPQPLPESDSDSSDED